MRNPRLLIGLFILSIFIFNTSCTKPEGYGGTASIKGKVINNYYNDDYSDLLDQAAAVDEEVFILFGDNATVGEREITGPEGDFEFKYLQPGAYQVYYMSEDSISDSRKNSPSITNIDLEAGDVIDMGELKRVVSLDFDDGTASIGGFIKLKNYKSFPEYPFLEVKDISFAQEQEVYIIYGSHEYYDDRIRTSHDGYFEFQNLIPGDYKVFTYSEDISGGTEDVVISTEVTIENPGQHILLDTITIEQL